MKIHDSPTGDEQLLRRLAERRRNKPQPEQDPQVYPEIAWWAVALIIGGTAVSVVYFLGRVRGWW
jgi:hypothetical protein